MFRKKNRAGEQELGIKIGLAPLGTKLIWSRSIWSQMSIATPKKKWKKMEKNHIAYSEQQAHYKSVWNQFLLKLWDAKGNNHKNRAREH